MRNSRGELARDLAAGIVGEVRQRDLGELTSLDEATLSRDLSRLIHAGWVAVSPEEDRREKLVVDS